jgi:hypothetical protein
MARQRSELLGDSIREIGILLTVFVPLELILRSGPAQWGYAIFFGLLGFILIIAGIRMESR